MKQTPLMDNLLTEGPDQKLTLAAAKCKKCGKISFPYRSVCTNCLEEDFEMVPVSREGILTTYTTTYSPVSRFSPPHNNGMVATPEGLHIFSVIKCAPEELRCGLPVVLEIGPLWTEEDEEIIGPYYRIRE